MNAGSWSVAASRGLDSADAGDTEEATLAEEKADDDKSEGNCNGGVDAVLDAAEDGDEHTGKEDDHLERRDAPELDNGSERCDDIADGVNNDTSKSSVGNIVKDLGQGVQREEHDNSGDNTGKGSANASLGLDGRSRE